MFFEDKPLLVAKVLEFQFVNIVIERCNDGVGADERMEPTCNGIPDLVVLKGPWKVWSILIGIEMNRRIDRERKRWRRHGHCETL